MIRATEILAPMRLLLLVDSAQYALVYEPSKDYLVVLALPQAIGVCPN